MIEPGVIVMDVSVAGGLTFCAFWEAAATAGVRIPANANTKLKIANAACPRSTLRFREEGMSSDFSKMLKALFTKNQIAAFARAVASEQGRMKCFFMERLLLPKKDEWTACLRG